MGPYFSITSCQGQDNWEKLILLKWEASLKPVFTLKDIKDPESTQSENRLKWKHSGRWWSGWILSSIYHNFKCLPVMFWFKEKYVLLLKKRVFFLKYWKLKYSRFSHLTVTKQIRKIYNKHAFQNISLFLVTGCMALFDSMFSVSCFFSL